MSHSIRDMYKARSPRPWWWPPLEATRLSGLLLIISVWLSPYFRSLRGTLDAPAERLVIVIGALLFTHYYLFLGWLNRAPNRFRSGPSRRRSLAHAFWWALAAVTTAVGVWAATTDLVSADPDGQPPPGSLPVLRLLVVVWTIPVLVVLWGRWQVWLHPADPQEMPSKGMLLALTQEQVRALTQASSDAARRDLARDFGGAKTWSLATGRQWPVAYRCLAERGLRQRTPASKLLDGLDGEQLCDADDGIVRLTERHQVPLVAVALDRVSMQSMRDAFEALRLGGSGDGAVDSGHDLHDIWHCFEAVRQFWSRASDAERAVAFVGR